MPLITPAIFNKTFELRQDTPYVLDDQNHRFALQGMVEHMGLDLDAVPVDETDALRRKFVTITLPAGTTMHVRQVHFDINAYNYHSMIYVRLGGAIDPILKECLEFGQMQTWALRRGDLDQMELWEGDRRATVLKNTDTFQLAEAFNFRLAGYTYPLEVARAAKRKALGLNLAQMDKELEVWHLIENDIMRGHHQEPGWSNRMYNQLVSIGVSETRIDLALNGQHDILAGPLVQIPAGTQIQIKSWCMSPYVRGMAKITLDDTVDPAWRKALLGPKSQIFKILPDHFLAMKLMRV